MYPTFKECLERYRGEIVIHKRSKEMETKLIKYILTEGFVNYKVDNPVLGIRRPTNPEPRSLKVFSFYF